ncbi:PIN domain-containing protein [Nocardia bovistercoris]|uniref:PIN domain-containing protein n=1 Tax=Nocardia bovistercoris TaxID=2785916 RepID=A0A931ID65_9NOCA|nr:PIN domain-containing protein [Nocardia bovistercoris]MBH0777618.1 PIN domain-containing protein [Nocardia bovistercoris]
MIVLDTGALIGIEKRDARTAALIQTAIGARRRITLPATVLSQAWRNSPRQHPIARLLAADGLIVAELDRRHALAVGTLLARSGTTDVVDAHVIVCARATRAATVVTSDPDDLRRLDPTIALTVV